MGLQGEARPLHGHAGYLRGCRCRACRLAYGAAGVARRPRGPLVLAAAARAHLEALRGLGVGRDRAAALAGLSIKRIADIRAGRVGRIRLETEARILAVRPSLARGQAVPAWHTWRQIRALESEGLTRADLARRLGFRKAALQFDHRSVRVRTALRVRALYERITDDGAMDAERGRLDGDASSVCG